MQAVIILLDWIYKLFEEKKSAVHLSCGSVCVQLSGCIAVLIQQSRSAEICRKPL